MSRPAAQRRRRLPAGLATILITLGALPLMAPTCGSPGESYKTFSRLSLVIPMDACYQYQTDQVTGSITPVGCPQATDPGNVIKAYGLVYELIRNGVPVYWIIDPSKGQVGNSNYGVAGVDLTIQYSGGVPVFFYDWTSGGQTGAPTTASHAINYRGGPFVVDGSDYAKASAVLQQFKSTFSSVNVHVSNVAFRGYAKRTMAGGWSAGGTVPPKLALLDIGSSGAGAKNSEYVIQGYLAQAGLDTANAGGTTTGTHGQIYDHLYMPDFIPTVAGDPTRTTLFQNGYQILWVPHWAAPSSCSDCPPGPSCSCSNKYPAATIAQALQTIGAFAAGHDLFAECAGLGSFEGVFASSPPNTSGYNTTYNSGDASTHFQTTGTTGVWINRNVGNVTLDGSFDSPFMQLGDYPFIARTGAIQNYKPNAYKNTPPDVTTKLISDSTDSTYDIFSILPRTTSHGTIVYLGGHSYSGNDGAFEIAGTRLVLNTLFNLGAACIPTSLPCNTGLFGICAQGAWGCDANGQPACIQTVFPRPETCNGLDDNCNGAVDEGLTTDCYDPPSGAADPLGRTGTTLANTRNVGICIGGVSSCQQNPDGTYSMSACVGQVTPAPESCNGLDDDCDGTVDNGLVQTCYDGPAYSIDANGNPKGVCKAGTQVCQNGAWGVCQGEVLPQPEVCSPDPGNVTTALDLNCDGALISCGCTDGNTRPCFSGPGTPGVGICKTGMQTCTGGTWGECTGEVIASFGPEACVSTTAYVKSADTNCDGKTTKCAACSGTQSEACYGSWGASDGTTPPSIAGKGQCNLGTRTCQAGNWGSCVGYGLPSAIEYCDNQDNNCNGLVDDNAICPSGSTCLAGVCVPSACGTERPPPEGYTCAANGSVQPGTCGNTGGPCSPGDLCQYGTCIDPCPTHFDPVANATVSSVCAKGTVCGGGACIAGGCYEQALPPGQLCLGGNQVPDPCAGLNCPSGTFCRQGDCVQACTFVTCAVGQKCSIDGFCVNDPCASVTCGAGQRCNGGKCAADPCNGLACATGQVCDASTGVALCVDDPCVGVHCPAGVCVLGQCYASGNLSGAGKASAESSSSGGCHCGSGSGVALPALLALLFAPLMRRRRRVAPGGRGAALLVALLSVALVAQGCKKNDTSSSFDPSTCAATCGEQHCVDLSSDPVNCGKCTTAQQSFACAAGWKCAAGVCGPSDAAPFIGALAPTVGNKDNPALAVTVSGQRFQPGATVRLSTPLGPRTVTCPQTAGGACQWLGAGTLQTTVDLTGIPVGPGTAPFTFRVVNPDHVISNLVTLGIVVPVPSLVGVSPTSVVAGAVATLAVSGTGFTMGSQCHLTGSGVGEIGLPSALNGGELDCQLDASTVPPGAYLLVVVSETGVRSNSLGVTVIPNNPVVISINPSIGQPSTAISLSVTGDRFDPTSKIVFDTTVITSTLYLDPAHLSVPSFTLPSTTGNYGVLVQTGAGVRSNAVNFTVGTNPPTITSFTPATAYEGNPAVPLQFVGTNFPPNSGIEVEAPGSTTYAFLASSSSTSTTVTATLSLAGQPEGTWNVRIRLGGPGAPSTVAWPLRVLSNQAILRSYGPAQSGMVGTTTASFTFQVSNLQGWPDLSGVRAVFFDPANPTVAIQSLAPTTTPPAGATSFTTPGFSLAGLKAGVYAFTVNNPNATPSNALTFSVTPGAPTLSTTGNAVCLQGTSCTQQVSLAALGTNPVITLTLTGTNFAPLDQNGNGSTVMVAADFSPNFPAADPCGSTTGGTQFQLVPGTLTVVSPTRIDVSVDTRNAYVNPTSGTTYYVEVYNPSGSGPPLKSGCGTTVTSLPWFKLVP